MTGSAAGLAGLVRPQLEQVVSAPCGLAFSSTLAQLVHAWIGFYDREWEFVKPLEA